MSSKSLRPHLLWTILVLRLLILEVKSSGLNLDGVLLFSFKLSILNDPLNVLKNWNYSDQTPCSWRGVTCGAQGTVTALSLPNSQLLGSIPADLGILQYLQRLDLSTNSLNGSLPFSILNSTQLQFLDLSNNLISGELPERIGLLQNLQVLNLSDNALVGNLPVNFNTLRNLTVVSLKNNYLVGPLPSELETVQVLDLSSNLMNGSLPQDFGGISLTYLNLSYNKLSGSIPQEFAAKIPNNTIIDLSFNNLTGEIPDLQPFLNQKATSFAGNSGLCGSPAKRPCPIPSSPTTTSATSSPPAIAAIPKTLDPSPATSPPGQQPSGLRPAAIIGIVIGDIVGVAILGMIFFYVYHFLKRKRKNLETSDKKDHSTNAKDSWSSSSSESRGFTRWSCLRKRGDDPEDESDSSTTDIENDPTTTTHDNKKQPQDRQLQNHNNHHHQEQNRAGTLVTVDGTEKELELETLLKASAYILGATGSSILYKAVLQDGTSLAVRRIGESHVDRFKDFESQIRVIAKLVHPNLVRIRGFYWGIEEKLIIYDFVQNGSLANARYRKAGSSPCHLPWEARLKIARGVARGLSFLHEKKHVHGNLKPSNILLGSDMDPKIGDFGLEKLVSGDTSYKTGGSARNFGSKRSTALRDSFHELSTGPSPSPSPSPSSIGGLSVYHAPESLRSLKPTPKWDVYSFGVILLELLTGKVIIVDELGNGSNGLAVEDKNRALRMADVAIQADLEGKEDALLACFKLGYSCASPIPQKRPPMKEVMQVLEKFPSSSPSYLYGP